MGWGISYEIALTWISLYLTADKSTLVQVMTWCPEAASHYLSKCRPRSMSTYGVTRPQWVNKLFVIFTTLISLSFHTTVPSANMPFHSTTIFTLAYLLPLSLVHLPQQKTPFKLATLYNKSTADSRPSFLLEEAILSYLKLLLICLLELGFGFDHSLPRGKPVGKSSHYRLFDCSANWRVKDYIVCGPQ